MAKLTKAERETIILWSEVDRVATITTLSASVAKRFRKLWGAPTVEMGGTSRWEIPLDDLRVGKRRRGVGASREALAALRARRVSG